MMNTQHTSGQWEVVQVSEKCTTIQCKPDRTDKRGGYIAEINWERTDGLTIDGPLLDQDKANARLIAAAPELLEALQNCMSWFYLNAKDKKIPLQGVGSPAFLEDVKAAIDKATK